MSSEFVLGYELSDVARARHWIRDQLAAQQPSVADGTVDDAELVVSELVTNSIRAGATSVRIHLSVEAAAVRIGVEDDAPGMPTPREAGNADDSGRGLPIVAAVSQRWGVDPTDAGKQTWALLARN